MNRWIAYLAVGALALSALVWFGLPSALTAMGLHPHYAIPKIDLAGRRALIITTSHATLDPAGDATGVFASEMTAPYYAFLDAGMDVDIASIKGGDIPIEPVSLRWPLRSPHDRRFLADPQFMAKVQQSLAIQNIDIDAYDIVFLAGGWGAAYDFAQSDMLGAQISRAYAGGAVVGGVCHGPLGLLAAKAPNGKPLVLGRRISAVTDKQIRELGISFTPKHPERDLRAAGALFGAETAYRDFFANHAAVDGRLVTGQNQNSGSETAHRMMEVALKQTDRVGR
ncbi:putative intracellular protease/amidase [Sphingomonas sp. BE123]|uniref:type 1 glutamine amidotransferase domain-containing protein n=1 Tax=Sphingomonas sp. BE123 TaxID=2817842 RepID=UPI002858D863|nr:type 1 glutamine amidotransferase domain-containing protein [Sphingomonas sp. BE123]MDR6850855.1 putative intracellular protease/amidase [Sphingomonas sp. BE123]